LAKTVSVIIVVLLYGLQLIRGLRLIFDQASDSIVFMFHFG